MRKALGRNLSGSGRSSCWTTMWRQAPAADEGSAARTADGASEDSILAVGARRRRECARLWVAWCVSSGDRGSRESVRGRTVGSLGGRRGGVRGSELARVQISLSAPARRVPEPLANPQYDRRSLLSQGSLEEEEEEEKKGAPEAAHVLGIPRARTQEPQVVQAQSREKAGEARESNEGGGEGGSQAGG